MISVGKKNEKLKYSLVLFIFTLCIVIVIVEYPIFVSYAKKVKDQDCLTTKISSRLFDFNTFSVELSKELNKNDFRVENQNSGKIIYQNGIVNKGIKNEYGHCVFILFYQDQKIAEIGHFKTNNWYTNDYILSIEKKDMMIVPTLVIQGKHASYFRFYNQYFN